MSIPTYARAEDEVLEPIIEIALFATKAGVNCVATIFFNDIPVLTAVPFFK